MVTHSQNITRIMYENTENFVQAHRVVGARFNLHIQGIDFAIIATRLHIPADVFDIYIESNKIVRCVQRFISWIQENFKMHAKTSRRGRPCTR